MSDRAARAQSFGAAAEAYERYRPGYTDEVANVVLAGLEAPIRALESGAGSGKATRVFLARGVDVTAVEPDPGMRAVLARVVPGVTVVASTLESLPAVWRTKPYDLVYAAAAWHWTDEATRWERAASLLRPGGVFASFGGPIDPDDAELAAAVEELRPDVPHAGPTSEAEQPDGSRLAWPGDELAASRWFSDVQQVPVTVVREWPADDYVGLLSTISAFLVQPPAEREARLTRIRSLLPDSLLVRHEVVVHRAVRTEVPASWPEVDVCP